MPPNEIGRWLHAYVAKYIAQSIAEMLHAAEMNIKNH